MFAALACCKDTDASDFVSRLRGTDNVTVDQFLAAVVRACRGGAASGSYHAVSKLGSGVCVRVAKEPFYDEHQAPLYWEMTCADELGSLGVGLTLLCFGIVRIGRRRRFVSCWPWVDCAPACVSRLDAEEKLRFGARIACVLERALQTCVHAESMKLANIVVTSTGEPRLIDWDPRFTRYVTSPEQRAAAVAMRAVYMLVLESMSPGLFAADAFVRAVEAAEAADAEAAEGPALAELVGASAAASVAALLPAFDAAFAAGMVQILQLYLVCGLRRRRAGSTPLFAQMSKTADDEAWAERLVAAGEAKPHLSALLHAAALVCLAPDASRAIQVALARVSLAHAASLRHASKPIERAESLSCDESPVV